MNICYIITRYWPAIGGAEIHTHELVKRISETHNVKVITQLKSDRIEDWLEETTIYAPQEPEKYSDNKAEVHLITVTSLERTILQPLVRMSKQMGGVWRVAFPTIRLIFRRKILEIACGCDIIHNVRAGCQYLSDVALQVARKLRIPYVFTPIPHLEGSNREVFKIFSKLYREADALIAMTEYEKRWLVRQGAKPERVYPIGVGPILAERSNRESFKDQYGINGPMVLFVGQKYPYKGYIEVLKATKEVWQRFPDTYFVFAGPRTRESVAVFSCLGDSRIIELGTLDDQEKTNAFAACDIFCMPSVQESFGGVFLEAWMMEKPVIAGDIPCERELIDNGMDGFLVKQDPKEIAERIIQLLSDEELRKQMGRRGKRKVITKYTWEEIANRMERIYGKLLEESGTQR